MRLTSSFWVSAYVRQCNASGAVALVERKGAEEAGAIFIRVEKLDGTCALYIPASQSFYAEAKPEERYWQLYQNNSGLTLEEAAAHITKEMKFDPDIWLVVVEERTGKHFLREDQVVKELK